MSLRYPQLFANMCVQVDLGILSSFLAKVTIVES